MKIRTYGILPPALESLKFGKKLRIREHEKIKIRDSFKNLYTCITKKCYEDMIAYVVHFAIAQWIRNL